MVQGSGLVAGPWILEGHVLRTWPGRVQDEVSLCFFTSPGWLCLWVTNDPSRLLPELVHHVRGR